MTLRNLLVRVGADISGLSKGLKRAQKDVKYFGRNVTGSLKEMQRNLTATMALFGGGFLAKSAVQDAMRFEALMTTLSESLGESMKDFEKWQGTVGSAMGFSRLQSAELANILSLNFRAIATDSEDLMKKTTKMMELAAVVSNKRGMAMTEVSNRIRSAMNMEADGAMELGVDVRIAAVKTSQAYKTMANNQPFDQMSEGLRKTILYHHIFEQVQKNLGLTMQDTTAMRMSVFMSSLADLRLALGQAFLPIVHTVLPILTRMAQALYRVMQYVSAFTRSLFGGFKQKAVSPINEEAVKAGTKAIDGMGDSATKAGKKSVASAKATKKAWTGLFGFDEVNTVDEPAETGGGAGGGAGGGGGGGIGGVFEDVGGEPNFSSFKESVDELAKSMSKYTEPIKKAFKVAYDFISDYLKEKIDQMKQWWAENGETVKQAGINIWNFIAPIFKAIGGFVLDSILMLVEGVVEAFGGIVKFLSGIFTGDFKKAWEGIKDFFWGAVKALFGFFNLTFIGGIRKALVGFIAKGIKSLLKFVDDFKKAFSEGLAKVKTYWSNILTNIKTIGKDIKNYVIARVEDMKSSFKTLWNKAEEWAKTAWKGIKSVFTNVASWFARTVINPVVSKIGEIRDAFSEGIGTGFKTIMNQIIRGINKGIVTINDVKNGLPFGNKIKDLPTLKTIALAKGGITSGPTLAMVGDNVGGREVVAPLDRLQSMLTNSVIQAMQLGGNAQQTSGDIVLNIDGRAFARVVKPFMDREENRRGSDVRIRTT